MQRARPSRRRRAKGAASLGVGLGALMSLFGCAAEDGSAERASRGQGKGDSATETNVVGVPCSGDDDCPAGVRCAHPSPDTAIGVCDVLNAGLGDADGGAE